MSRPDPLRLLPLQFGLHLFAGYGVITNDMGVLTAQSGLSISYIQEVK
jgi:hypothetical protein